MKVQAIAANKALKMLFQLRFHAHNRGEKGIGEEVITVICGYTVIVQATCLILRPLSDSSKKLEKAWEHLSCNMDMR